MRFSEAVVEKKKMLEFYPNAVHLEIIDWNNKRENIVLKNQQQVENFRLMHKGWDVKINEIRGVW